MIYFDNAATTRKKPEEVYADDADEQEKDPNDAWFDNADDAADYPEPTEEQKDRPAPTAEDMEDATIADTEEEREIERWKI